MTKIKPFKAIRPTRDKAYLVPTRPFYTYKKKILKAKIASNPFTFLHVINPEFSKDNVSVPNSDERFKSVKAKFDEFLAEGIFIQEKEDSFYIYRQTTERHIYTGIIAGASVKSYQENKIKKHEATLTEREETFTKYLSIVIFNAEPVLLFHENHAKLKSIYAEEVQKRAEYEFSTTQRIKHELWIVDDPERIQEIQDCFKEIDELYIADGHHRSASSSRFYNEHGDSSQNADYFLSYLISEENVTIFDYNRLVKDLNGLSETEFIAKLSTSFDVDSNVTQISSENPHQICMYLNQNWHKLTIKSELIDEKDPVKSLDTYILNELLLEPILGIKDIKTDSRISFVEGTKGSRGITRKVNSGEFAVGFLLHPVSVDQLKKVADTNQIMPPKSTWIEPKLRSGLTIYPLK